MCQKSGLNALPREQILPTCNVPPWTNLEKFTASHTNVIAASRTDPPEIRRRPAEETLKQINQEGLNICTDGSAKDGTEYGGARVLAMRSEGRKEQTAPTGRFTTSLHAEMEALQIGL